MIVTPDPDRLIDSTTACAIAGGISDMSLWRWERAGILPKPLRIRRRKYWVRSEFLAALHAAGRAGGE